ncbi:MAG: winged helix-turn-helix domain-containing protein [Kaiparowitsia implicata GSE-PSE-MK54-09C]|jgi:TolB-like protein|nr:winged helix-turn-helix domain-containing protein [Kaiparowitsia implicata GSE-PSE-MK54-09C]
MSWSFGDFQIDPERFLLSCRNVPVRLEPQVLSLLIFLIRNRDHMVTKDEIVAAVWQGEAVSDASISSRIRSARQAVGDNGEQQTVIRTVHGRGFRFVPEVTTSSTARAASEAPPQVTPDRPGGRPSIAVLPFQQLGMPPGLAILGDAIPHEIIEALSRLRWLAVIARGSTFRLREVATDLDLVSNALAARYILSGVIECPGPNIAVTLELTDSSSREIIWADRLAAPVDGVGDLRSRIVAHLVSALESHIPYNEARIAQMSDPAGLDAWAYYHIGLGHLYRFTAAGNAIAQLCFERAVRADPQLSRAHAGLSFTSFLEAFLRLSPNPASAARNARRHAERALELDSLDPFANFTMGRTFWLSNDPEIAANWLARATTLNPNYAQGFYASAFTAMLMGNAPAAFGALDTSLHLSPLDPLLYGIHGVRAQMLIQQEDDQAAAGWADRAATTSGAHFLIAMIALVANGLAGRHEQAGRWRQKVRRLNANATSEHYFAAFPTREATSRARIAMELRRQGF